MISLMDFQERSLKGPVMKPDEFDLAFSMKVREVVKKYNIKYNPDQLVADDATGDSVFLAGVEVLSDVGLYHLNTSRVIKFSRDEVLELAEERKRNPGKAVFGKGPDEMIIQYRSKDDARPPTLYVGIGGAITEEEFVPLATTFAKEKRIEGMGISGGIVKVGDIEPKAGTLSEIHCGLWEQEQLQKAIESVGRPGMNLGLLCTVSTVGATMQCLDRGFRGPHNTQIGVHVIPEQKIDWDRLILSHFCKDRGIVPWQSAMCLIGGLCRDAADAAVGLVANALGQMSYAGGPMCSLFPTHLDGTWSTRESIWAVTAAMRASERNIGLAIGSGPVGSYQWAGTVVGILQQAVTALAYTAAGFSYAWLGGCSVMEAVMVGDTMNKAAEAGPREAEKLAKEIIKRVDELVKKVKPRETLITFKEVYDIETATPLPVYEETLNTGREELGRFGL
jgi:methylamine--corrinoid protein Co-methyltransferase